LHDCEPRALVAGRIQLLVVWKNQVPLPPARAEETATTPASTSAVSTRLRMVIPASFVAGHGPARLT